MFNSVTYLALLLYFISFLQGTYFSFLGSTVFSVLIVVFLRSSRYKKFHLPFIIIFLSLSFFLCISYLFSSQSLLIGLSDYALSLRNISLILVSIVCADSIKRIGRPTLFFRIITFLFLANIFVASIEHFTGIYLLSFLRPIVDTFASVFEEGGQARPLGIFLNPNASAFFSAIYLFFLFLVCRQWLGKFVNVLFSTYILSYIGSRNPYFIFILSVFFYSIFSLFFSKKRFFVIRAFVFVSFLIFIFSSFFLCFRFDIVTSYLSDILSIIVNYILPTATQSLRVILDQFTESRSMYSIMYSCLLPSSNTLYSSSLEVLSLHGNEVSLRYFLIAFSLPVTGFMMYWLIRLLGIFSFFLVFSLLHYNFLFSPLLFVMCILFQHYFSDGLKLRGFSLC